jgi:hypothetical protein
MSFGSDAAVLWDLLRLHHEATGLLTLNGLELVEAAPVEVRGGGWATPDLWS